MRNNAKKGIFIIAVAGTMAGLSFGISKAKEKEVYPILAEKTTIRYANEDSSTTNTETTTSTNTENTTSTLYKDENNNGIPDKLEELVASKDIDNIMGTTIAAAMNACLNVITFIYGLHKWKSLKNGVNETACEATKNVNKFAATTSEITAKVKEQQETIDKIQDSVAKAISSEDKQTEAIQALKESNEALTKGYADISTRLDAILANQALTANTEENIRSGVADTIKSNVKGAIEYGSKSQRN